VAVTQNFYDRPHVFDTYRRKRHSGTASPNQMMEDPALRRELGPTAGLRIADLGCGDASISTDLLAGGCMQYYGLDASEAMVRAARTTVAAADRTGRVRIDVGRLEDFRFPPGSFDLIISRLALHYVDDVQAVLQNCARALSPGGRVVLTVLHPVITSSDASVQDGTAARTSWLVDDYFSTGPRQRPWLDDTVTWYHRTVEDYVSALLGAGFSLSALRECAPERDSFGADQAEFARRRRTPLFLLLSGRMP
jgi:SAM-dependent methyltransferase